MSSECGSEKFERGWLARDLRESASDLAMNWDPEQVSELLTPPLCAADKARLRQKMAARYRAWNPGRDLADDLAADALAEHRQVLEAACPTPV